MHRLRMGDIFWYDRCPPLEGGPRKRRPIVVVVSDDELGDSLDPVFAVGVTTEPSDYYDRIPLPNLREDPGARTGLFEPCFALPKWIVAVHRDELTDANFIGRLEGAILLRLAEAVEHRLDEPDDLGRPDAFGR